MSAGWRAMGANMWRLILVLLCLLGCGARTDFETDIDARAPAPPASSSYRVYDVLWRTAPSQSNGYGTNAGLAYTNADVPYWDSYVTTRPTDADLSKNAEAFTSIHGGHGADSAIAKAMVEGGLHPIIVNVSRGSTFSAQWIHRVPPEAVYMNARAEVEQAWAALQALKPDATFRHWHVIDQGEAEIRYGYPTPAASQLAVIHAWESNANAAHAWLEDVIGAAIDRLCFLTNYNISKASASASIRAQQLSWAGPNRAIDRDSLRWESDGVHLQAQGYIDAGTAAGRRLVELTSSGAQQ